MAHLSDVRQFHVPSKVLEHTTKALRAFGRHRLEGLVLWLGSIAETRAMVVQALVPDQTPISDETGVGYFVDQRTLFEINRFLSSQRLRLLAQVHSHPTHAYHSSTDDRYALVTTEGGLSIVVPYFAEQPVRPETSAVYRLTNGAWRDVTEGSIRDLFVVEED